MRTLRRAGTTAAEPWRPPQLAVESVNGRAPSVRALQYQPANSGREVEAGLARQGDRLQRDGLVRAANQYIRAEPGSERGLRRRADIGAAQGARFGGRCEDRPND